MNRKKIFIENLNKIEGKKFGTDLSVLKVASQMHYFVIYVHEWDTNNIVEVKVKRESDNKYKPYRWTMQNGNTVRPMFKKDFETPDIFLAHLNDFLAPVPF